MAGLSARTGAEARRTRRIGAIVAASAAVHLLILSVVGFSAPKLFLPAMPPGTAIEVWLTPDLTPKTHKAKLRPVAATETPARPLPVSRPVRPVAVPSPIRAPAPPLKTAPTLTGVVGAPGSRPAPSGPPALEGPGGGAEEALRTSVGCDYERMVHLNASERERCNQKIGEMARRAPAFNGMDPLKRGRFDDQAAADERRRAARTGPLGQPVDCSSGNASCLPDSAIGHLKIPNPNN